MQEGSVSWAALSSTDFLGGLTRMLKLCPPGPACCNLFLIHKMLPYWQAFQNRWRLSFYALNAWLGLRTQGAWTLVAEWSWILGKLAGLLPFPRVSETLWSPTQLTEVTVIRAKGLAWDSVETAGS